jgi:hypothetical protein
MTSDAQLVSRSSDGSLGFLQLRDQPPEVTPLSRWLDSWIGLGDVITGLTRQGLDVELRRWGVSVSVALSTAADATT